jgi:glycine betaine catabolism A
MTTTSQTSPTPPAEVGVDRYAAPVLDEALLDPAGTDPDGLARALEPFGRSRMLPAAAYTSPEVLAWERRNLFAGTWTCVGRETDLRSGADGEAVSRRAVAVGDVSVLLTWDAGDPGADGAPVLRAFANTCRHRGHELMPADGSQGPLGDRPTIVCPYHAWSYKLSGELRAAPGFHEVEGFDRDEHALVGLPVERWHGWVFVHALRTLEQGPPVPFAEHVGTLEKIIGPYAPERLALADRHSYEVAANWKVIVENYHECYHCPLIHPELCQVSPPSSGENYDMPGAWVGGSMDLRDGMASMSLTGEAAGAPIPGVDPLRVEYVQLWPNLLLSPHPDYVMVHRLVPIAPDRTWVECSWYGVDPGDGTAPDVSGGVDFWDLTNKQDWSACESVQRGLSSPHFKPGPFAPAEDAVHAFVGMVGRAYRGLPLG